MGLSSPFFSADSMSASLKKDFDPDAGDDRQYG
jgi:hypothetical protein